MCYVISEEMSVEVFSPIWSHVNTKKKNRKNSKMQNFEKLKTKWSGDMVKRYLSTKFDINLLDEFWQNGFYGRTTAGRMTDDGRQHDNRRSRCAVQ